MAKRGCREQQIKSPSVTPELIRWHFGRIAWNWFTAPQTHNFAHVIKRVRAGAGKAVWPNINQERINRNCYTLCGVEQLFLLALFVDEVGSCLFFVCGDTFACDWTRECHGNSQARPPTNIFTHLIYGRSHFLLFPRFHYDNIGRRAAKNGRTCSERDQIRQFFRWRYRPPKIQLGSWITLCKLHKLTLLDPKDMPMNAINRSHQSSSRIIYSDNSNNLKISNIIYFNELHTFQPEITIFNQNLFMPYKNSNERP